MKKIGILGGTFDPPHLVHRAMADSALEQLGLDEVIWVPAFRNPLKGEASTTPLQRLEMVRLAAEDESRFSVSDVEISRTGPSYMVETVEELGLIRPSAKWWLVLGSDSMKRIQEWRHAERLARMVRFAVVIRPPDRFGGVKAGLPRLFADQMDEVKTKVSLLASTHIRADLRSGTDCSKSLSDAVSEYIREKGLYQKVREQEEGRD